MKIKMPSLSPTMMEGTIVEWHKAEGTASFTCRNLRKEMSNLAMQGPTFPGDQGHIP